MGWRFSQVLIVILLLVGTGAGAQEQVTIGIMEFAATKGVSQDKADVLADIMAASITRLGNVRVITKADIMSMVDLEKRKRMVDCTTTECVNEVGGALGIEWIVTGTIARFGEVHLLTLKLFDLRAVEVASRAVRRVKGAEEQLLDEMPLAVKDLFDQAADRLQLVPTVTVASRRIQLLTESPAAVTVLTRTEILASGANDIVDLLRRVPGFDVYEVKPSYPVVGARALTEESNNLVLTLINGREALVEFAGSTLWGALEIDLEEIERIEVIRGPGSALYGANAYAGVVSITTISERPSKSTRVVMSGGEEGQVRLFGRLNHFFDVGEGKLDFGVSLGTQGRRSASDRLDEIIDVRLRTHGYLRYRKGRELAVSLMAGGTDGTGIFFTHVGDMRVQNARHHFELARAEYSLSDTIRVSGQVYQAYYGAVFQPRTSYSAYGMWLFDFSDVSWDTSTFDAKVQLDWEAGRDLLLIAGGNTRYTTVEMKNMFVSEGTDLRAATFLHVQWHPWDVLQLVAGLRADMASEAQEKLALSPRGVMVYRPWEHHAFRLGYGLAFRKPSIYESRVHAQIENYNTAMPEITEKLADEMGNETLLNEKVHSFEAGWRGRFLEESLHLSVELFYNIYLDNISFEIDIPNRLGLPDILGSTIQFQNESAEITALGGEAELSWSVSEDWSMWCNLGLRRAKNQRTGERRVQEPLYRVNLGGRYLPFRGMLVDFALHYVSEYQMPLMNPANMLNAPRFEDLGDHFLVIGRVGYRLVIGKEQNLEGGVTFRTPLGKDYREYAGVPLEPSQQIESGSDFGGDTIVRLVSFYLRGSF